MKDGLRAALWAALFMPACIVIHEAAHYAGYLAFGLPDPTLSYASGGFAGMRDYWIMLRDGDRVAAEALAQIRDVGLAALFGPLLTIILGSAGLLLLIARQSLAGGALAFAAFFRAVPIAVVYALGTPEHTDEAHITLTLGLPDAPITLLQVAGLAATIWLLVRHSTWQITLAIVAGGIASLGIWMAALGPLLLAE
jgi:hypothetical protein